MSDSRLTNAPEPEGGHRLERLAERLATSRHDESQPPALPELRRLVSMLADRNIQTEDRLASALEGLARWVDRADSDLPPAPSPAGRQPQAPNRSPAPAAAEAELEARLTDFARSLSSPAPVAAPDSNHQVEAPVTPREKPAPLGSLRAALAEISARQRDLDADDERQAPVTPAPSPDLPSHDIGELRREIETLGGAIRDLPTRTEVDGLAREMAGLARRLGEDRPARLDPASLRAIDALVAEVDRMRGDAASPQMLARFADELSAVANRLDHLAPANAESVEALALRIEAVRDELAQFPRMDAVESLAADIQTLVARLDAEEKASRPAREAVAELTGKVAVLGGKIDGIAAAAEQRAEEAGRMSEVVRSELAALSNGDAMDGFSRQIEALTAKLESRRMQAQPSDELFTKVDAVSGKLDAIVAANEARASDAERVAAAVRAELAAIAAPAAGIDQVGRNIEALTLELARRPAPAATETVEKLSGKIDGLGLLVESVASAARARGASAERVEEAVRGIAEHLLATAESGATGVSGLAGLESRIVQVMEGLDRTGGRIDDLNAGFASLASRVEQSCAASIAEASRKAVAELRDDLAQPGALRADDGDQLARAIIEIKSASKRDDRRTADTLDAVRLTLERLIDRMEAIDAALAERTSGALGEPRPSFESRQQTAPAPRVDATEAARAAARRAMEEIESSSEPAPRFGRAPVQPVFTPVADLAPDHPLEPGSALRADPAAQPPLELSSSYGFEPRTESRPEAATPAGALSAAALIASARRAVLQSVGDDEPQAASDATPGEPRSRLAGVIATLKAKRKPILLGIAAALIVLGVLKAATSVQDEADVAPEPTHSSEIAPSAAPPAVTPAPAPAPAPKAEAPEPAAPATPEPTPAQPAAPKPRADFAPPRAKAADITDYAFSHAADPSARTFTSPPKKDDIVTGSINRSGDALPDSIGGSMLRLRAVQGDPSAQLEIADRLAAGRGVEADPAAAARWLEKAAAQGLAPAQHRLGSLYEKGRGVPRDLAAARRWYEQAAASGNVRAMHNLGVMHAEGGLGKPDFGAATVWFRMASERGLVDSQYNLAVLEARGLGGKRDLADAYKWFSLASAQGDQDAGRKRDEVAKALGAANLAAANQLVASFKPRAVDPAANEAPAPAGGWDQATAKPASAPMELR